MQRFGPRTRYRLATSSIFVLLYRYFVIHQKILQTHKQENKISGTSEYSFNLQQRTEQLHAIIKDLKNHSTEENMHVLYHLFLQRISYRYGKHYEHLTLEEIQQNQGLPQNIIELLSKLYTPIYKQEEYPIDTQKDIAKMIKDIVSPNKHIRKDDGTASST